MTSFRHHRYLIGIFLAAMFFVAGGIPGLVAAGQGVQIQAPLCTPNGTEPAGNSDSSGDVFDHCQICPLATALSGGTRNDHSHPLEPYALLRVMVPSDIRPETHARAELMPLTGRAPPFQI